MTSSERPFRFGVNLRTIDDRQTWLDGARQVEELGYDILLVPDHLGFPGPYVPDRDSRADRSEAEQAAGADRDQLHHRQ